MCYLFCPSMKSLLCPLAIIHFINGLDKRNTIQRCNHQRHECSVFLSDCVAPSLLASRLMGNFIRTLCLNTVRSGHFDEEIIGCSIFFSVICITLSYVRILSDFLFVASSDTPFIWKFFDEKKNSLQILIFFQRDQNNFFNNGPWIGKVKSKLKSIP